VDPSCLFCNENESIFHLIFGCAVASRIWELVSQIVGISMGNDYESVARLWLCNKRFGIINIISLAVCWCLWKLRNHLCFQDGMWSSLKMFWQRPAPMLRCWRILVSTEKRDGFDSIIAQLVNLVWRPEQICMDQLGRPNRSPGARGTQNVIGMFAFKPP
jgi:hypothetical protein